MTSLEKFLYLLNSFIEFTDFEEIMYNLPDKSPNMEIFYDIIDKLKKYSKIEKDEHRRAIFAKFTLIYEEMRDNLVYVPFVAFTKVFVRMIDTLISHHENENKEFILVLPPESLNLHFDNKDFSFDHSSFMGIKSNIIFTSLLINYLTIKGKLNIISGIVFYDLILTSQKTIGIFRDNPEEFVFVEDRELNENWWFIYCDDGLYSGSQFNEAESALENIGIELTPLIPYMRENYVPKNPLPGLIYEKFPVATQISGRLCKTSEFNVLGYFQHKIPDYLSISFCFPFLDHLNEKTKENFGTYRSLAKNVNSKQKDSTAIAEYKLISYMKNLSLDSETMKIFHRRDIDAKNPRFIVNFSISDIERAMKSLILGIKFSRP